MPLRGNKLCEDAQLLERVIEIGDWNMKADATKSVAHGLILGDIRNCNVIIRNDDDTEKYELGCYGGTTLPASQKIIDTTNVNLQKKVSGDFNSTDFDSTSYNRGWIVITYIKAI